MVDPDLGGVGLRGLEVLPIAYEPFLYLADVHLARPSLVLKRACDLVLASILLVVLSPIMLAIAVAIRAGDGGPALFKQARVGKDGRLFAVYKFRTMRVDAEARLAALRAQNERHGPLFKLSADPRITRIGHFLRDSSLDELPQLINVLRGEMSLVGPRPALPSEVEEFPEELRQREDVTPGITGLWQVEARDNPSFELYRRLDLYYVRNWSLVLDLVIVLATIEQVLVRLIRLRRGGEEVQRSHGSRHG